MEEGSIKGKARETAARERLGPKLLALGKMDVYMPRTVSYLGKLEKRQENTFSLEPPEGTQSC